MGGFVVFETKRPVGLPVAFVEKQFQPNRLSGHHLPPFEPIYPNVTTDETQTR